tara:strand:+ start:114 stop:281 length:168 start_codon:yes stop_codon:yes gene_type:complete
MPLLNKKEKNIVHEKIERKEELTLEEISDLQETNDFEEGLILLNAHMSKYEDIRK